MLVFIQDFWRKLRYFYRLALRKIQPVVSVIRSPYDRIIHYYKNHPESAPMDFDPGTSGLFVIATTHGSVDRNAKQPGTA